MDLSNYLPNHWLNKPKNPEDILSLPTINQLKDLLIKYEQTYPVNKVEFPFCQYDDENKFIVTKTQRAYSLKPNITKKWFLYRGESKCYPSCIANLYRGKEVNHLANNVRRMEFQNLLDSHPLIHLFRRGIPLSNEINLRIYNPYGLAQHYYLRTNQLDLTSDIDVASFFAVTDYDSNTDTYSIHDIKKSEYGQLYVYHMKMPFNFLSLFCGLTTIGLQPFLRPARQKGFLQLLHNKKDLNSIDCVTSVFFRHDSTIAKPIFENMQEGKYLFPDDELSEMAKYIRSTPTLSIEAFERNLRENPDYPNKNKTLLEQAGIHIDKDRKPLLFTKDNLDTYYNRMKDGGWESFCNKLIFPFHEKLKDELIKIKDRSEYYNYFYR